MICRLDIFCKEAQSTKNSYPQNTSPLEELPPELQNMIFSYLRPVELSRVSLLKRSFHLVVCPKLKRLQTIITELTQQAIAKKQADEAAPRLPGAPHNLTFALMMADGGLPEVEHHVQGELKKRSADELLHNNKKIRNNPDQGTKQLLNNIRL